MRLGIHLPQYGRAASPEAIRAVAIRAEELGFADVWVSDHIVQPADQKYPSPYLFEPLLSLAWAAAVTELSVLHRWAAGGNWKEVPLPGKNTVAVAHDIRSYYDEAALQLVEGPPPGGRAAEAWFFETTEAGKTMLAARKAFEAQGAPFPFWFYMAPGHR